MEIKDIFIIHIFLPKIVFFLILSTYIQFRPIVEYFLNQSFHSIMISS